VQVISEEHISNQDWGDVQLPRMLNDEISNIFFKNENQILEADDVTVWIDPLDATQEYTENLVEYVTTMVCVAVSGVPMIGVIHRPFQKETFWSIVDQANSPNLEQLKISANKDLHKPLRIVVSRSHAGNVRNLTKHLKDIEIVEAAGAGIGESM
jgi:inositol monophosphatase 3